MATTKPTKPNNEFLPTGFGGTKEDFSSDKKTQGFSSNIADILRGDNLNYTLDTIGLQLKYLTNVVDYLVGINNNKIPYVNGDGKFDSGDINTFLPSQTGNSGKFLTTNGSAISWAENLTDIGEPIFTLNFNKTLSSRYKWLEGQVVSKTEYPSLFAVYGYTYDTSYDGTDNFKLPNFINCTIWGGTTGGRLEAGLPNITAEGILSSTAITKKSTTYNNTFYKGALQLSDTSQVKPDVNDDAQGNNGGTVTFDASRSSTIYGNSTTVQPQAIKVRVYTRVE